eukprot:TRINITY_DN4567_c0_g1_i1.p1 TRINITY_DN4567_c0_g1~~TRINITY_DN4567_c0_g1_i1.p1  ORF type:complete len:124 (+),score=19.31 TRINITY_DN4567_c0_g1_i1:47-373(+)
MDPSEVSVCWVTCPKELTEKLAKELVETEIVACVNAIPQVTSYFKWKGEMCSEKEDLLMIKTLTKNVPLVIETVKANHTYDSPEIITSKLDGGIPSYLSWVKESCTKS